jgi:hypothetical protein
MRVIAREPSAAISIKLVVFFEITLLVKKPARNGVLCFCPSLLTYNHALQIKFFFLTFDLLKNLSIK